MSTPSILESEYIPPSRPYSGNEITDLHNNFNRRLHLSEHRAYHSECSHFYHVTKGGRKETSLLASGDSGNCSVCWKLNKTPRHIRNNAYDLVNAYSTTFENTDIPLYYGTYDLEHAFYIWLYREFNVQNK